MGTYRQQVGALGEAIAAQFLISKGYKVLDQHITARVGEIDLLCEDKDALVFVEVKTRRSTAFGFGEEAVGKRKQEKLRRAIERYLMMHETTLSPRFDVVVVEMQGNASTCLHYENVELCYNC